MINPYPKMDLTRKDTDGDVQYKEKVQKMLELSKARAEFLTTCTEKEFNKYKLLRQRMKNIQKKT